MYTCMHDMYVFQEKEEAHKLKRNPQGHRPGVPGTPSRKSKGLPAGVPGISCCLRWKTDRKGQFCLQQAFRNSMWFSLMHLFCLHVCMHACMHACMYVYVCVCVYTCVCVYVCVCVCVCVFVFGCICPCFHAFVHELGWHPSISGEIGVSPFFFPPWQPGKRVSGCGLMRADLPSRPRLLQQNPLQNQCFGASDFVEKHKKITLQSKFLGLLSCKEETHTSGSNIAKEIPWWKFFFVNLQKWFPNKCSRELFCKNVRPGW